MYIHVILPNYVKDKIMEFRAPKIVIRQNADAIEYLTKGLSDPAAGRQLMLRLFEELGNVIDGYPDWHPILTAPPRDVREPISSLSQLLVYAALDHTVKCVRGFVTCPYSEAKANEIVNAVNQVPGLYAYRLEEPLYMDNAFPVVVVAQDIKLEADGTIRSRDALAWFVQQSAKDALNAQVGETWWNIRSNILGRPHGSRSSLFVNQHAGGHMRKILDALNDSGMFGPLKEHSLEMLSQKKRDKISETLLRTAVTNWNKYDEEFEFELRGEICKAALRDTWGDGLELSIRVEVGDYDLYASGFYYAEGDRITHCDPIGKRAIAEKFL
jgi:hypothetical protein